jgi:PAS domain S-box-containing protein
MCQCKDSSSSGFSASPTPPVASISMQMSTLPTGATSTLVDPLWQDRLSLLLESTGEGIFGIDLDGHCTFINRAGAAILGYGSGDVLGKNMHWLTHHSHADGRHYADTDCPIFNAFRRGLPCRLDTEVFWKHDHTSFPVEYSSYPIMEGSMVRGAVITFVDITERKAAADALTRARDELEVRVKERTQELSIAVGQLRELAAYSERVREEERTRIAREIHDELGSLLVALKMDVNWLKKRIAEPEPALERMQKKCSDMNRLIEDAVQNVGRIITDLRPSILDHQGLWAALEWQAQEFVRSAELTLYWDAEIGDKPSFPDAMSIAVFRIFQEMLSNVGRHARASELRVQIVANEKELLLRVEDDGCGAEPGAFDAPDAYGIMGMRERARSFLGRIEIRSLPGQGSAFELLMPVAVSTPSAATLSWSMPGARS